VSDPASPADLPPPAARRARVLVVDDNQDLVECLVEVVAMLGHDVHGVTSGEEALRHLAAEPSDVVLMDVSMPGLNGFDTARGVRRESWGRSVFLVAMTGWGREEDRQLALDAGFDWMLAKPVDVEGIRALLAEYRGTGNDDAGDRENGARTLHSLPRSGLTLAGDAPGPRVPERRPLQ